MLDLLLLSSALWFQWIAWPVVFVFLAVLLAMPPLNDGGRVREAKRALLGRVDAGRNGSAAGRRRSESSLVAKGTVSKISEKFQTNKPPPKPTVVPTSCHRTSGVTRIPKFVGKTSAPVKNDMQRTRVRVCDSAEELPVDKPAFFTPLAFVADSSASSSSSDDSSSCSDSEKSVCEQRTHKVVEESSSVDKPGSPSSSGYESVEETTTASIVSTAAVPYSWVFGDVHDASGGGFTTDGVVLTGPEDRLEKLVTFTTSLFTTACPALTSAKPTQDVDQQTPQAFLPRRGNNVPSMISGGYLSPILECSSTEPNSFETVDGDEKIFFRAGVVQTLESQRDEKLSGVITQLQAQCRGYLARKDFAKLKVNDIAIRCIQRNVKKFMLVRDWPWWRLLVRITPLLNVHRTEYELKQKSDELDQLRVRVDKLEQERSQLKADNDRLEQRLADTTADLAEEHSTVTMVSERLEMESAERQRLEKELQEVQSAKNRLAETNEQLEMQLLCLRSTDPSLMSSSSSVAGTVSDDDSAVATSDKGDQYYRRRYERVCRELDYAKKRLQQQHNDDMEQLVAMKKQLEKKLAGVYEDVEEQRQIVAQWKRKVNKLNAESNDLKLMLEESNSRNNLLEKKQKKFDTEIHSLQEELKNDKALREKITREKDMAISDKFAMEQNLSSVRLELELKEQKVVGLNRELQELTFNGNTEEEVAALKRSKHQLENKLKDQEEELDDLAGQVQLLEQVKTRLEMGLEQERKEHRRELAQREQENEEIRCSAAKKIKALECEIENEHEERTALIRERHDLERRLVDAEDRERCRSMNDQETIARFRRDMKKLKALLRDAQTVQEQRSDSHANRIAIRQLRNQLEDAESARDSAIKARLMAETDLAEVTATLDEVQATKRASEERAAAFSRDKNHLQSQLDENEEELAEVLKKYRGTVQQLSAEQSIQQEQASRIAELETDKTNLQERLAELTFRLDNMETHGDPAGSLNLKRLQLRVTELESKLQLELTTRTRLEVQITRLKEAAERLESEREAAQSKENSAQETLRKMQRSLREARESMTERETKESADTNRKRALEKRAEQAEAEVATVKADLALALQRIDDLQAAMTGDLDDDDEFQSDSDDDDDGDSDDSVNTFLANQGTRNTSVLQQKSLDSN
ncbi:unconventional myosin-XVIIIa-like isoform X3 [Daktulosphaira vitifoliae]|uniref:unconventional myosin-XVIIIa-like isoform X3 n=1 Tax=Daktulosphaira vitifoliae TaxID=58002 RepID=UPI0021A9FDF5|nr:unconventional myosin-XVIIIa-like isoform X3 [Daktulosphaira vitifoliae]